MKSFVLPFLAALTAIGQAQLDPFDYHCADVVLLQAKQVQTELAITETQRKKMNDAADTHRVRLTTYDQQQRAAKTKDSQDVVRNKLRGYYDELKKGVFTSLTPAQLKRLREITLQRAGLLALLDDIVAKKVGLTGASLENFKKAFQDGAKQAETLQSNALKPIYDKYGPRIKAAKTDDERKSIQTQMQPEIEAAGKVVGPKIAKLQSDTQQKLVGLLGAQQKSAWQALLGKPFNPSK